jgi:hypothetical protein
LESKIDANIYKIFYGRDIEKDSVLESRERFDLESYYSYDEPLMNVSAHWNKLAQNRTQNLWAWEKVVQCLQKTFKPENAFEIKMANSETEFPFSCTCCFLCDYDNVNPIVYCEECDSGVHQKCFGIDSELLENIENGKSTEQQAVNFTCDLCFAQTRKRKVLEDIHCIICKKNEGMMK